MLKKLGTTPKVEQWTGILLASSILIMLVVIGITTALLWTIYPDPITGITDTTLENVVFFSARYIALPCGILNVVTVIFIRFQGLSKKVYSIAGILIGALGILIGLLAWAWFVMVSSFVF